MRRNSKRYWIDDPSISWTASQVKKLPKQKRIEVAVSWFLQRFQDPAIETPYETREGGYQYIWGGPYDAADEIGNEFASILSDAEVEDAVEKVQEDGIYDWAPIRTDDLEEANDQSRDLNTWSDIGQSKELELRQEILTRLRDLEEILDQNNSASATPGIGHNNPPETISSPLDIHFRKLRVNVQQLNLIFLTDSPRRDEAEKQAGIFRKTIDGIVDLSNKIAIKAISEAPFAIATNIESKIAALPLIIENAELAWISIRNWLSLAPPF
ncbi:hypothetical protein ACSHT2_01650 [Bradyrhizobium sp. PUT101]|uniref:hypothetical protein n=1 Tax=Bradyrhizobium sp. PUT101 TaxID=3447427 RepID=UPI003F87CD30